LSVEERVLEYLRGNPGATPREIADALGTSLASVRVALNRLRELGYVIRSSRGGYVVRVAQQPVITYSASTPTAPRVEGGSTGTAGQDLMRVINELVAKVSELSERVSKLEGEVRYIKKSLPFINNRRGVSRASEGGGDQVNSILKLRGVITVEEFKSLTSKPIDHYINSNKVVVIDNLVVEPNFLKKFKSRFPIKVSEVGRLSPEEQKLLEAMVKLGHAYLHSGMEYRVVE